MIDLDALERLLAEATPGPWVTQYTVDRDAEDYSAECVRLSYAYSDEIGEPRRTSLHMAYAGEWDHGGVITALTGNGPTSEENAALIAAMRNALPALIAAARRAERLEAALQRFKERDQSDGPCWCISSEQEHDGWLHAPRCLAARAALAPGEEI